MLVTREYSPAGGELTFDFMALSRGVILGPQFAFFFLGEWVRRGALGISRCVGGLLQGLKVVAWLNIGWRRDDLYSRSELVTWPPNRVLFTSSQNRKVTATEPERKKMRMPCIVYPTV